MKSRYLLAIYAITLILAGVGGKVLGQGASDKVCFTGEAGQQCVPVSVVAAAFTGYTEGSPAPTHALRQELITTQQQLASTIGQFRQCEGILGPLQAEQHKQMLQQQQQFLDAEAVKAAPAGMQWDAAQHKYVPAPKPTTPPPTPNGRGGR